MKHGLQRGQASAAAPLSSPGQPRASSGASPSSSSLSSSPHGGPVSGEGLPDERTERRAMSSCVTGRVDAVAPQACRVNGIWHAYPRGWAGRRPAVGQVVRVEARLAWIIERVEPVPEAPSSGSATQPAPARLPQAAPPNGIRSRTAASASASPANAVGQRQQVSGVVAASNERGVKLGDTWYNYSRVTPVPEPVRARLMPGVRVSLEVDRRRWIAGMVIEAEGPGDPAAEEEGWDGSVDEEWGLSPDQDAEERGGGQG